MKKGIIAGLLMIGICSASYGQKYLTRTGKITFFSGTPIENIEAFNNEVAAILDAKTGDVIFQAPVMSFKFEKELMREHFNDDYMESSKFPKSTFKGVIDNLSSVDFTKDGKYDVTVSGKLTMHGVTQDVKVPGTIIVNGNKITAQTKFSVVPQDYGIKIPSLVEKKIAKKIDITVDSDLTAIKK